MIYKKVFKKPFFYRFLLLFFPKMVWEDVAIAFGKRIYIGDEREFKNYHLKHEEEHLRQQSNSYLGAIIWWIKYLWDPKFRFEMELAAYKVQLKEILLETKTPRLRMVWLEHIADCISGDTYGRMITKLDAIKKLNGY